MRRNCCGRPKHGSLWHDITALTLIEGILNHWSCLMFTDSDKKVQTGNVELMGRVEIGRREQRADTVGRQRHIEFVELQSRRMRKRKRSMPRRAPTVAISRRLRSWRSSSRRRRMKTNKRLAARVQQSGKARDTEVESEDASDEEEAANLDELQTLVDLSSKYFPNSVHNATLRAKRNAEQKKKTRCQASPSSDLQYVETIGEEAQSNLKMRRRVQR